MKALASVALSATGFYFSIYLGDVWALMWVAPIPVLWFVFQSERRWLRLLCAFAAYALGSLNVLNAYWDLLPIPVLAIAIVGPALCFAGSAVAARFVGSRLGGVAGALAFGAAWTTFDFAVSFGPDGTFISPAYTQVGAPMLIQSASLFGLWAVTFVLAVSAAGIAFALARKSWAPAALAAAVFALNLGYGAWRLETSPAGAMVRVGLAANDALERGGSSEDDPRAVDSIIDAYVQTTRALAARGARLIVLPEKLAIVRGPERDYALTAFAAAAQQSDATVVVGLDEIDRQRWNRAYIFTPTGRIQSYDKRHPVPGLERMYSIGHSGLSFAPHEGVAICKDMDFQRTLRGDASHETLRLLTAPAWDFGADGWAHARMAILRGVENGFAVARAAKEGLLTLSDAQGRVVARAHSGAANMTLLVGDLPLGPGPTLYTRIGDVFAWLCAAGILGLLGAAVRRAQAK